MTFDNEVITLAHLVTFPSIWLPPENTVKVIVVGATADIVQQALVTAQQNWPNKSWAFYYVPDFDIGNQEHVDWLVINSQHVHGKIAFVTTPNDLAVSESLGGSYVVDSPCADWARRLLSAKAKTPHTLHMALNQILQSAGMAQP